VRLEVDVRSPISPCLETTRTLPQRHTPRATPSSFFPFFLPAPSRNLVSIVTNNVMTWGNRRIP
jgi:hypothetical protein